MKNISQTNKDKICGDEKSTENFVFSPKHRAPCWGEPPLGEKPQEKNQTELRKGLDFGANP